MMRWLPSIRSNGKGVFAPRFPSSISDLRRGKVFDAVPLDLEVGWAAQIIRSNAEKINQFMDVARAYERELIIGQYSRCLELLDGMERTHGVSLWTLESRIALLQHSSGIESQKAMLAAVLKVRPKNDLVSFLAYYISHRNEETTVAARFITQFIQSVGSAKITPDFEAYLAFRVVNRFPDEPDRFAGILRYEGPSALIDYYDTFVRLAGAAVLSKPLEVGPIFCAGLRQIADTVTDLRVKKALYLAEDSIDWLKEIPPRDLSAEDTELGAKFAESVGAAIARSQEVPEDASVWYTGAISAAQLAPPILPEDSVALGARIFRRLFAMISSSGEARNDSVVALERLVLNFRLSAFSALLEWFLWQELSSLPLRRSSVGPLAFLNSPFLEPALLRDLVNPSKYQTLIKQVYGLCPSICAELVRTGLADVGLLRDKCDLSVDVEQQLQAESALRGNRYEAAVDSATLLMQSANLRLRRLGARLKAESLLALTNMGDLVEFVVSEILADPDLGYMLPLKECVAFFDDARRAEFAFRLSTPILFSLSLKYTDWSDASIVSDSYEDFLITHDMLKPSDLRGRISEFQLPQLVYYLRELCVPSIMHLSTAFETSRELEDERLAICSLLAQIDETNAKLYETEAREITRTQTIRTGVRHAELSKIFVDLDAIRRWSESNLKERFTRYLSLLAAGVGVEDSSFTEAINEFVLSGTPLPKGFLEVPKNEAYALLTDMTASLLHEFTLNPIHGLDCYLSMRIRHGTLSGQLRSPLEEEQLITQRTIGSLEYKRNDYWLARLAHLPPEEQEEIITRLARLSQEYDAFIDRIANDLIQIRSSEKPDGLFNIIVTSAQLRLLAAKIKPGSTFDEFLEMSFETLWTLVEVCLRNVRQVIDRDLKAQVNKMFGDLEAEIDVVPGGLSTSGLAGAIKAARTRAQIALDRVKDWFQLSKPVSEPQFTLEQLVDVGLQMVRNVHREFDPVVTKRVPDSTPDCRGVNVLHRYLLHNL